MKLHPVILLALVSSAGAAHATIPAARSTARGRHATVRAAQGDAERERQREEAKFAILEQRRALGDARATKRPSLPSLMEPLSASVTDRVVLPG
eukprot:1006893-Prymnesium_polylepis.1